MTTDRAWRPNPGTSERAKDPNAMVWLRFRCGQESLAPQRRRQTSSAFENVRNLIGNHRASGGWKAWRATLTI